MCSPGSSRSAPSSPGKIEATQSELRRLVIDLDSLAAIRLFAPDNRVAAQFRVTARGLAIADRPLLRVIHKRVGACLQNYRNKGIVRDIEGPGRSVLREIVR